MWVGSHRRPQNQLFCKIEMSNDPTQKTNPFFLFLAHLRDRLVSLGEVGAGAEHSRGRLPEQLDGENLHPLGPVAVLSAPGGVEGVE